MQQIVTLLSLLFIHWSLCAQHAAFIDNGFIPESLSAGIRGDASNFQTAIYNEGNVYVATSNGIWKNNIASGQWDSTGLRGRKIVSLYKHPSIANKFYAGVMLDSANAFPLYISVDSGHTWAAAANPVNENYYCIAINPLTPNIVFANVEGANMAVSSDRGNTWAFMNNNGGGFIGYYSNIMLVSADPYHVYQGSENPLDDAWLGRYDIDSSNPILITDFKKIAAGTSGPYGNRRPNKLQAYDYTPDRLYVGQEGALSKVNIMDTNRVKFIFESTDSTVPYSYIYGIWVDPADTNHIIWGGGRNSDNTNLMQIYETYDEGNTFFRYSQLFGLSVPIVCDIVAIGNGDVAVIVNDVGHFQVKLIVMRPQVSGLANSIAISAVSIYPNPTDNKVIVEVQDGMQGDETIALYNGMGELLVKEPCASQKCVIDLSNFPAGVYHLSIQSKDGVQTKKILRT